MLESAGVRAPEVVRLLNPLDADGVKAWLDGGCVLMRCSKYAERALATRKG